MNLGYARLHSKREIWDHVAKEFGYSCGICGWRPAFEDLADYLTTGLCGDCAQTGAGGAGGKNLEQA